MFSVCYRLENVLNPEIIRVNKSNMQVIMSLGKRNIPLVFTM